MKDITPDESTAPVYLVPPTDEQLVEREKWATDQLAQEQEVLNQGIIRESALQKLVDLGLTIEEAKAVVGI